MLVPRFWKCEMFLRHGKLSFWCPIAVRESGLTMNVPNKCLLHSELQLALLSELMLNF